MASESEIIVAVGPIEAEIEAVKADQQWWQQVEEPLGLRLSGWTFRKRALFFDISTDAVVDLPGSVAERVIAGRRVAPAPSFAEMDRRGTVIEQLEARIAYIDNIYMGAIDNLMHHQRQLDADGIEVGVSRQALCEVLDAVNAAHNPQASNGGYDPTTQPYDEPFRHTDPQRSGAAEGNEAEAPAPKSDPAIAELVERLREPTGYDDAHLRDLLDAAAVALAAADDRVAELERERDEALATMTRATEAMVECGNLLADEELKREAAEAEVSRLKAGAVTDGWQSIDTAPTRDENGVASRLLGFFNDRDGGRVDTIWRMDGTKPYWVSTTIELTRGVRYMRAHQPTYWRPLPAGPAFEAALSNQAKASK